MRSSARLLDDAEDLLVPLRVAADAAGILLGDVEADAAVDDAGLELGQRLGERLHLVERALQEEEGQPLRGLGADAGQPLERFDEARHRLRIVGH